MFQEPNALLSLLNCPVFLAIIGLIHTKAARKTPPVSRNNKMKKLYLIGGTMGVGKTATSQALKRKLNNAVFLDGDWCWDSDPFQVTAETKKMVMENIRFLLNQFIHCPAYDNVIFCWVMHEQSIMDDILSGLDLSECTVRCVSLVCTPEALTERLLRDIKKGIRSKDIIDRSIPRIPLYDRINSVKLDVSDITPLQAAEIIAAM